MGSDLPAVPDDDAPGLRLSDADREAAVAALAVHRDAGRISGTEYEDRWATVRQARVRADLRPVFVDLPAPHGTPDPVRATPVPAPQPLPAPARGGGFNPGVLVALSPFVALILFTLTRSWVWFLLVPVSAVLVGGYRRQR